MSADEGRDPAPSLSPELIEAIADAALRSADPAEAIAALAREHPDYAAAIRAAAAGPESEALTEVTPPSRAVLAEPARPTEIGPYRIVSVLGEGGMGTVYKAEQREPVQRIVALKVIKLGMDSREVLQRFELERRALAAMSHSCIARVFDAGTTERGQPYFVMEYVEGVPLTDWCDRNRLTLRQRIELFQQVCAGVQHAHQKGIVHRDLKPGNILVMQEGERAVPKVLDFGLAKATGDEDFAHSRFTVHKEVMGTPEYMAPEQAAGDDRVIDTRADIYSLGVLLYEVLVGELPFPGTELRRAGILEIQRVLREVDPPKPSTRITTLADHGTALARRRRVTVSALTKALKSDLDWVVMKALEKERNRRYDTANALAADLQRYLDHEPLVAGPPRTGYRIRKFARRYRLQVGAVALVLLASLTATLIVSVALERARSSEGREKKRAQQLAESRNEERAQRLLAERRRDDLMLVTEFQASRLEKLDVAAFGGSLRDGVLRLAAEAWGRSEHDPQEVVDQSKALEVMLAGTDFAQLAREALEANVFEPAFAEIENLFPEPAELKISLMKALASPLLALGLPERALATSQQCLALCESIHGERHATTLGLRLEVGRYLAECGRSKEAEMEAREALNQVRLLGDAELALIESQALQLYGATLKARGAFAEAESVLRESYDATRQLCGDDSEATAVPASLLGQVLCDLGRPELGLPLIENALAVLDATYGENHFNALRTRMSYAVQLKKLGRNRESLHEHREVLRIRVQRYGEDHLLAHTARHNLALLLGDMGHLEDSHVLLRTVLASRERLLGREHVATAATLTALGEVLWAKSRSQAAVTMLEDASAIRTKILGPSHPNTLYVRKELGIVLLEMGKLVEAEAQLRVLWQDCEEALASGHELTLSVMLKLGDTIRNAGRFEEAEPLHRAVLEQRRELLGDTHPATLRALHAYANTLCVLHRPREAAIYARLAVDGRIRVYGEHSVHALSSMRVLTWCQAGMLVSFDSAPPPEVWDVVIHTWRGWFDGWRNWKGTEDRRTIEAALYGANCMRWHGERLLEVGDLAAARGMFEDGLELYAEYYPRAQPGSVKDQYLGKYVQCLRVAQRCIETEANRSPSEWLEQKARLIAVRLDELAR